VPLIIVDLTTVFCVRHSVYCINNSMKWSSLWEANGLPASREIPCIYETEILIAVFTKSHPFLELELTQLNPVDTVTSYCFKIHFNIVPATSRCSRLLISFLSQSSVYIPLDHQWKSYFPMHPSVWLYHIFGNLTCHGHSNQDFPFVMV
jgi:hypothetical protein